MIDLIHRVQDPRLRNEMLREWKRRSLGPPSTADLIRRLYSVGGYLVQRPSIGWKKYKAHVVTNYQGNSLTLCHGIPLGERLEIDVAEAKTYWLCINCARKLKGRVSLLEQQR